MKFINKTLCFFIRVYQKRLSPAKGFACAHRVLHKGDSCSTAIHQIIETQGVLSGLPAIAERFRGCREAAVTLSSGHRADLDCGIGGCFDVGGAGGCVGDLFGSGAETASGRFGSGNCLVVGDCFPFRGKRGRRNLLITGCIAAVMLIAGYMTYGNRITSIEIKLMDEAAEDKDRKWSLVENSELPDYQLVLEANNRTIKSSTVHNRSALNWLSLRLPEEFKTGEIVSLEITNRQLLNNKILESFTPVDIKGSGEIYRYRLVRRWDLFQGF